LIIDAIIEAIELKDDKEEYTQIRKEGIDPFFHNSPHILIIYSENKLDLRNSTIAMTYGMLSAELLDLGTCWIGGVQMFLNDHRDIQKEVLGINGKILGMITIGYPTVKYYRVPPRSEIDIKEI